MLQKWAHTEDILMKLYLCFFSLIKDDELLKSWYKVSHAINDLTVNMYTVKDI